MEEKSYFIYSSSKEVRAETEERKLEVGTDVVAMAPALSWFVLESLFSLLSYAPLEDLLRSETTHNEPCPPISITN